MKKQIALIGLGKMGKNMALKLSEKNWNVFGFDINLELRKQVSKSGIKIFSALEELVKNLSRPRLIWLMVPAGQPVEDTLFGKNGLIGFLRKGDIVIDGGNS